MNKLTSWLIDNKVAAALSAFFILATGFLGWFSYSAWDDYSTALAEYATKASQLANLSHRKPFPSQGNLAKLSEIMDREQADLKKLNKTLQGYNIPAFNNLDKVKPQDMPQQFQDGLRNEVTRIKALAAASGVTLPPGFYLGLEEYENTLPQQEETIALAKQLTVLSWMAETVSGEKGLILAEFTSVKAQSAAKKDLQKRVAAPSSESLPTPYQTTGTLRLSFRCNQGSLRQLINVISAAPYFLLIEGIQLENTSKEPPRREGVPQGAEPPRDGGTSIQRLPIIVGRELLNVSLKVRSIEFQDLSQATPAPVSKQ